MTKSCSSSREIVKGCERFSNRELQTSNSHVKKQNSMLLIIREVQIKETLWFYLMPSKLSKYDKRCKQSLLEELYKDSLYCGVINYNKLFWKVVWNYSHPSISPSQPPLPPKKRLKPLAQTLNFQVSILRRSLTGKKEKKLYIHPNIYSSTFNSKELETNQMPNV